MENIDQTNYQQQSQQPKIRIPATLFSKSHAKSPVDALRLHQSPANSNPHPAHSNPHPANSQPTPFCQNHPQKQASYCVTSEDDRLLFCEKCAITLASQGHAISRLKGETPRLSSPAVASSRVTGSRIKTSQGVRGRREAQVESFLGSVRELRGTISNTRQTIKQKLIQSQQFYGGQLQQINDYFTLVVRSLQLQKHKCYNHILRERQQAELSIREINEELTDVERDVTRIMSDIEDNLDTVYSIEENMYQLVLSQHVAQRDEFSKILGGILLTPIEMRRIQFEGVPDSIYNLSDLVIQNSMNSQQSHQYRLVDSLGAGDLSNICAVSPRQEIRDSTPYRQISHTDSLKFSFEAQKNRADRRDLKTSGSNSYAD